MPSDTHRYDFDRVFRMVLTIGGAAAVFTMVYVLRGVLLPFAVAVMGAYFLNPIVNAFEERTGSRSLAVVLTLVLLFIALLVTLPLTTWMLVTELGDIAEVLSEQHLWDKISDVIHQRFDQIKGLLPDQVKDVDSIREFMLQWVKELKDDLRLTDLRKAYKPFEDSIQAVVGFAASGLVTLTVACSACAIIVVYLVFLMIDFNMFQSRWKEQLPPDYREAIVEFWTEFSNAMGRYFRGQFMVAMICGVLFAIGFWIVGIRLAVVLGLFIGVLNMVPYLQIAGLFPAVLLALLKSFEGDGSAFGPLIGVLIVFGLVQVIQDTILVPKIMGSSTGLRPWVIMLSMFIWGQLLGFLGLVLAIPLSCLGLAYYRRSVLKIHDATAVEA